MRRPSPSREEFHLANPKGGRPPKHGGEFVFGDPTSWGIEQAVTVTETRLYGKATAQAWDRLHPRLTRRAAWLDHDGPLPIIEGTVIRLVVQKLPSGGVNKPIWLWWSRTGATEADVDRCWQSFLRRFDIEHTFRLFKQTLGWTKPRLRRSEAADRWTWLVIAAYAQLRLARPVATVLMWGLGPAPASVIMASRMTYMPKPNPPQLATIDDTARISRTLARAFDDDPMMRWFFPDDSSRGTGLERYFTRIFTRQYVRQAVCERTDAAAAFWVPAESQAQAVPDRATIRELQSILGDRAVLFRDTVETAATHVPREPHLYLAVIGAAPAAQGQGHGAALLRSGLAKADAAGLPVYLESSAPANVPFYEHFGFTVREDLQLPGGGPRLWAMWREARRPAHTSPAD